MIGVQSPPLTHGPTDLSSTDLHAQALLTAFMENDKFQGVTFKLTDLLKMVYDEKLFYHDPNDKENPAPNLLEHLIRHQEGLDPANPNDGDHMLDRFTEDMWKIAQDGGQTMTTDPNLTKALIAFAMQAYYDNKLPGSEEKLFSDDGISGGLRFDRSKIADSLNAIKGYNNPDGGTKYFQDFLSTLPEPERTKITAQLPDLLDWFVRTGNQTMTATAGDKRAFMLGGASVDNLTGSTQADLLIGLAGADILSGGKGDDTLMGGKGFDTYIRSLGDGNDTIIEEREANGKISGIIKIENGQYDLTAAGFFEKDDDYLFNNLRENLVRMAA